MSPYYESVSLIQTPFVGNQAAPGWQAADDFADGQNTVHKRMFLILAVVSMIVIALVLFALPDSTTASSPAAATSGVAQEATINQPASETNIAAEAPASSDGISPIFTTEVRHWEDKIIEWAAAQNLDPNIVATIMQIESCGDPQAVSVAGARGLFQVMPFHFSGGEDMLDPDTNARRGLNFYNEQLRYTGNDILLSFAGYNGGYAASGGNPSNWPAETRRYYDWAKGIYEDAASGATRSETLEAWLAAGGAAGCQRAASRLNVS